MDTHSIELLATRDVSKIFDKSEATIRLWVRAGKLRAIRLPSGQSVFERGEVMRLFAEIGPTGHGVAAIGQEYEPCAPPRSIGVDMAEAGKDRSVVVPHETGKVRNR